MILVKDPTPETIWLQSWCHDDEGSRFWSEDQQDMGCPDDCLHDLDGMDVVRVPEYRLHRPGLIIWDTTLPEDDE